MNLTSPNRVRALLAELGVQPSRSLGQNFLIDANVLRILLDAAELSAADRILEVGPGLGVLTGALAARVAGLVAVEKDRRLADHLRCRFSGHPAIEVIAGDMLAQRVEQLGGGRLNKVVANLPYRPGTRILVDLVRSGTPPDLMVLTVQREVADRLTAEAGSGDYGLLTVWVGRRYDVELVKLVSPTCFRPAPAVTSAIVRLRRHERHPLSETAATCFHVLTKQAFSVRRKQLLTALRQSGDGTWRLGHAETAAWVESRGLAQAVRPSELTVADWCDLAGATAQNVSQNAS